MAISSSKGMMTGAVVLGLGGCLLAGFGTYAGINSSLNMGRTRMERIMATKQAGPQSVEESNNSGSEDVSSSQGNAASGSNVESSGNKNETKANDTQSAGDGKGQTEEKASGASGHADVDDPAKGNEGSKENKETTEAKTEEKTDSGNKESVQKSSESAPVAKDGNYAVYAVTWGDVLDSVSKRSGVPVEELARINGVSDLTLVCTETTIHVPSGVTLKDAADVGRG